MSRAIAAPEQTAGAAGASRHRRLVAAATLVVAAVALLLSYVALGPFVYPLAGGAVNVALAVLFGRTLRAGREPLITTFARAERGTIEPDLVRYTRSLTVVWVAFFVCAALASIALGLFAHRAPALAAIALGNWLAVAALFVGEWLFRRWRFRHYRHASPLKLAMIVIAHWRRGMAR